MINILGEKIKYIRTFILNQTQSEFSKNIGVSRKTVLYWEYGYSNPNANNLIIISLLGNVTIDSLVFENKEIELDTNNLQNQDYAILKSLIDYLINLNFGDLYHD